MAPYNLRRVQSARWLASIALIPLPTTAYAQAGQAAAGPAPSAQAVESATQQTGVEDIIVTAQRRDERLQDVPIAISAITATAAARQGITGTESLGVAIPALQFSRQGANGGAPFVRGVGSIQASTGSESPVAVYIDDVYIGAPVGTLLQFNNIESTEVLKGPQGTLFGRNATGGVVNIHTKRPSFDPSVDVTAGFGSFQTYSGSFYATSGLSKTVAVNFAATGRDQVDGYGRNVATGKDAFKGKSYNFRSQLLWEPGPDTSVLLAGDFGHYRGDIGQSPVIAPGTVAIGGGTFQCKYCTLSSPNDFGDARSGGLSLRVEQKFGDYTVRSITARRWNNLHFVLDSDGSLPGRPPIIVTDATGYTNTFSEELQLLSPQDSAFKWILGGFYYNAVASFDPLRTSGLAFAALGGASVTDTKQVLNSYSGFGEGSYELLPSTKITLGLRYTTDDYHLDALLRTATGVVRSPTPFEKNDSFSKLTYRAILDSKFTPDILGYASYSRGFKSGGYNVSSPTITVAGVASPAPVIEPEVLDAYEVGLKTEFFDHRVRVNVAAFHYDYSNLQVGIIQNGTTVTLNAAKARINGLDVEYTLVPSSRVNITGGFSLLDAKYVSFPSGPLYVPTPATCTPTPRTTGPATGGNTICLADLTSNHTSRSPRFTMSLSTSYTLPTSVGDFLISGTWFHNSGFYWEADNRYRQPRYDLVNANLSWTSTDKTYDVKFYANNILNEYYYTYLSETTGRDSWSPEMPRNYGIQFGVHF